MAVKPENDDKSKKAPKAFSLDDPKLPKWVEEGALGSGGYPYKETMSGKDYDRTLEALQTELVKLQQWIIETHSEPMLRRVQRLVRAGRLDPSFVSVLLVQRDGVVRQMRLLSDGEFVGDWPPEFFEVVFRELFDGVDALP